MRKDTRLLLTVAGILAALPGVASAQTAGVGGSVSVGYQFLSAVRDRDTNKALGLLQSNGAAVINFRTDNGESALHVVASNRDLTWLGYLVQEGGDVNLPNRQNGDTPLHIAARSGWLEGVDLLVGRRARVDATNRLGETPLIVAVQHRQLPVIRRLLEVGADPSRTDNASGRSARDYAKLDSRSGREITQLMDTVKPKAARPVAGPKL